MPVTFHFQEVSFEFKDQDLLSDFIIHLFDNEGFKVDTIRYIFCTDQYLLTLNQGFLHHDTYTDILTFDLSEQPEEITAEIYISSERVEENAEKFQTSFNEELHRVIFHGALHICGYDDHSQEDMKLMRQKEEENLTAYFKNRSSLEK